MSDETPQDSEFNAFYRATYARTLGRLMYKWPSLPQQDAEEIVLDGYRRLWSNWTKVRDPGAYLWKAVGHATIDHWRKQGGTEEIPCEDPGLYTTRAASASGEPEQYVAVSHIVSAFQQLSASDQKVIREADGMTTEALAEALGVKPGAARVRLHRARQRATKVITQEEGNE
ncbi:sigma-70 family RNA polymerase sigma factor [Streptomyces sp. MC1]|uniref:RNA polymerase sigma factor n=1 Tax=Streptomyces sp. MC1 TaxID=295105 RepID=UPI0018CB4DDD|nr:sigma-70 family RNA polymerase sigma factor [Streptomyces sp. MC1]MBG7704824.1 sigma-70 family RNA polymerase sigma factor [Streptomyces sp. MC1]